MATGGQRGKRLAQVFEQVRVEPEKTIRALDFFFFLALRIAYPNRMPGPVLKTQGVSTEFLYHSIPT